MSFRSLRQAQNHNFKQFLQANYEQQKTINQLEVGDEEKRN